MQGRAQMCLLIEDGNAKQLFKDMDKDNDGRITKAELNGFLMQSGLDNHLFDVAFDNLIIENSKGDTDSGDADSVDAEALLKEFTNMVSEMKKMALKDLKAMDTNQDKVVDRKEFSAAGGSDSEFDRYDENHDGVLDANELAMMRMLRKGPKTDENQEIGSKDDPAQGMTPSMGNLEIETNSLSLGSQAWHTTI